LGYVSDSTYLPRRLQAFNPATKKLFEYGLIGLAIGAALVAGLQFRPPTVFPSQGTLDIRLTAGVPVLQLFTQSPPSDACHGHCNATSINVTITLIEVHTSGIDNMTGTWAPVCTANIPLTIDIVKLVTVTQFLCGANLQPDTITNIRLTVSSVIAKISGEPAPVSLSLPSGKLEIPMSPLAQIEAGKTTTIMVEFSPHIVHEGNGQYKLTPVLDATTTGPD
jgi:Domain of unknown function (DUF4382)